MNELKTLKDCGLDVGTHLVIQTEAMKWEKHFKKQLENSVDTHFIAGIQARRSLLKTFFNLKEEEEEDLE